MGYAGNLDPDFIFPTAIAEYAKKANLVISTKNDEFNYYIGEEAILNTKLKDQEVFIGIRPEGFIVDPKGSLTCDLRNVEVMGRDMSVVCIHKDVLSPILRAIIPSDTKIDHNAKNIKFSLKEHKVFVFKKEEQPEDCARLI